MNARIFKGLGSAVAIVYALLLQAKSDNWTYVEIDNDRQKWGDWAEPEWLRYFGLHSGDVSNDGYPDIVSGRYVYLNPGKDLTGEWKRIDLGLNTDGALILDIDGDEYADIISTSLPSVYWWEASDTAGTHWKSQMIAKIPETGHVNGQGFGVADIIQGGKKEILIASGKGIYLLASPTAKKPKKWKMYNIVPDASDEGFAAGDIDGDGDLDIAAAAFEKDGEGVLKRLFWWENPGEEQGFDTAKIHFIHESLHDIDRIEIADLDGDGRNDIIYSEERYPGLEPDAHLVWLKAPNHVKVDRWVAESIIEQYSMNNLDVGDVDQDGDIDIVTNEHKGEALHTQLLVNDGSGKFEVKLIDTGKEMHLGAQLMDFDNDGDLDLYGHAWDRYQYLHLWRND